MAEEEARAEAYLDPSTLRALRATTETELVDRHANRVLAEGFEGMLRDDRREDLRRLHRLLSRVGAGGRLRDAFAAATRREGAAIVRDEENDKDMVRRLLEMKRRAGVVVADSFAGEEAYASALKESFESFVNCRQNRPAELIAKFIDAKLSRWGVDGGRGDGVRVGRRAGALQVHPGEGRVRGVLQERPRETAAAG